jgi:hypothetical protein
MSHAIRTTRRAVSGIVLASVVWLMICAPPLSAQDHDWRGREFWVVFLENEGSGGIVERSDLRLYLSSDRPTSAIITYNQTGEERTIPIQVANTTVEVSINALFGNDVELVDPATEGEISRRSLRIAAQDEVTLYGVNIRNKSSDAFLALPEDVLTRHYMVMAYTNGYDSFAPSDYDMPSEFAVVATEDGTTVRVVPRTGMNINGRPDDAPFTILLNRGEAFFAQAQLGMAQDLTGTEVVTTKPVAVFGGVRRASVPTAVGNYRDHLCEQIPPLEVWGNEAILVPHFPVTEGSSQPAVARVLSATDNTGWTLNGIPQSPLRRGVPVELQLRNPHIINADGPILVGQYEHSVDVTDDMGRAELGDPFMMLIPPSQQYDTGYAFQAIIHTEFILHYINVVVPTDAWHTVLLDGIQPTASFLQVPGSRYSYAQIQVTPGAHYIRADSPFGLYSYGYGRANSYGYAGGSLYHQLVHDFEHPELALNVGCDGLTGIAWDDNSTDWGIDSCYALADTVNMEVVVDPFPSGADTVRFYARLLDPYQDGLFAIRAIDSGGRSGSSKIAIPGFTLQATGMQYETPVLLDTLVLYNGGEFCRTIEIENYGGFPRTIDSVRLVPDAGQKLKVRTPLPLTIPPGGRVKLNVCVRGWSDSVLFTAVEIGDTCVSRPVAILPLTSGIDTNAPVVVKTSGRCMDEVLLTFVESQERFAGINGIVFDTLINCSGAYLPDEEKFPVPGLSVRVKRINPRKELIYHITVIDAAGNYRTVIDTLGGFTLAVAGPSGETVGLLENRDWIGDSLMLSTIRCDSVVLRNYGSRPLRIDWARMTGNLSYSIPPAQLPVEIPPYGERKVLVCIEGTLTGEVVDTLLVAGECGDEERVVMKIAVKEFQSAGTDMCNSMVHMQSGMAKRTFLAAPIPNPVHDAGMTVDLGLIREEAVTLEVINSDASEASAVLQDARLPAGITRVGIDLSKLPDGAYFCRMRTAGGEVRLQKIIIKR